MTGMFGGSICFLSSPTNCVNLFWFRESSSFAILPHEILQYSCDITFHSAAFIQSNALPVLCLSRPCPTKHKVS